MQVNDYKEQKLKIHGKLHVLKKKKKNYKALTTNITIVFILLFRHLANQTKVVECFINFMEQITGCVKC